VLIYIITKKEEKKQKKKLGGHRPNTVKTHKCVGQPERALQAL